MSRKKYDVIFVHLTSPFFIGLPAVMLKRKLRIPLIFWVLDLWPESLTAAGGINNKILLNSQIKLAQYVYNNCDTILIGSQGFKKSICEKGDYAEKLVYFPNWAEDVAHSRDASNYLKEEPFAHFTNDDFLILFAGNIGEAQNLDSVLEAAFTLKINTEIKFVFLGDGRKREQLIHKADNMGLSKTVFFPGHFPLDCMPVFMQRSDILLVSLKDELIFNLTVPSKLQVYMAQGKPVLAMLTGDGADLIKNAQCGVCVPAGNSKALSQTIKIIYKDKDNLKVLGINGKLYYEKHFKKKDKINQLDFILKNQA
jgi:glycosyltransferase involved in cell wall biosynthesis